MDEEINIIDEKTRNEKIKSFFIDNKKLLVTAIIFLILVILSFYSYQIYQDAHRKGLSDKYNAAIIDYDSGDKTKIVNSMTDVVKEKDSTYSPLALYFLIDNELINDSEEINLLFDVLINETPLEAEIKNLIIYKKALYNADTIKENELIDILKPLTNSNSIWKSHALYLIAEYFYSKNEKQKSKEFFNQVINSENANIDIIKKSQKRLNRDLSE